MAKTLNDFTPKTSLANTDQIVGYSSTAAGGEFRVAVSNLFNRVNTAKAWVTASYRAVNGGAVAPQPRIIEAYNVTNFVKISNSRFYVIFSPGVFANKKYCVLSDSAGTIADRIWVSATGYTEVPSEAGEATLSLNNDFAHKSPTICKFEATNPAYLPEFYIAFFGI